MPNPFFFGGHITDPDQFVGRKAKLYRNSSCVFGPEERVARTDLASTVAKGVKA